MPDIQQEPNNGQPSHLPTYVYISTHLHQLKPGSKSVLTWLPAVRVFVSRLLRRDSDIWRTAFLLDARDGDNPENCDLGLFRIASSTSNPFPLSVF